MLFQDYDVFFDQPNNCFQLRTKTNVYLIEFDDTEKSDVFAALTDMAKSNGSTIDKIVRTLKKQYPEEKVLEVFATLGDYGLIPYDPSYHNGNGQNGNGTEHDGKSAQQSAYAADRQFSEDKKIALFGETPLTRELQQCINDAGFKSVKQYPTEKLCKDDDLSALEEIMDKSDFLVADGTGWNPFFLDKLNRLALDKNKPWMYIGGIEGRQIKFGPIFYGKETGCYQCLTQRIKSNHEHGSFLDSYEQYLNASRSNAKPDSSPYPVLFHRVIAALATAEITKFFEHWHIPVTWRSYISMDISTYEVIKHHLLKVPFCDACKPELLYNPAPWLESVALR